MEEQAQTASATQQKLDAERIRLEAIEKQMAERLAKLEYRERAFEQAETAYKSRIAKLRELI